MIDPYQDRLEQIHFAILNQRVIQFKINHVWRTVEPYVTGLSGGSQCPCLYGFCRDTTVNRWQVFSLEKIQALELTYYGFERHLDYIGPGHLFQQVFRRLPLLRAVRNQRTNPVRAFKKVRLGQRQ